MKPADCILFSGGAPGAEAAFGECAERHGVEEVNFTFDGTPIGAPSRRAHAQPRGAALRRRQPRVRVAADEPPVHRGPTLRKILQTLWYQVNNGQEIYVIGTIQDDGTVRGGTGWGAEFAKLCNKPLLRLRSGEGRLVFVDRRRRGRRTGADPGHHASALHRHRHATPPGQRPPRDRRSAHAIIPVAPATPDRTRTSSPAASARTCR